MSSLGVYGILMLDNISSFLIISTLVMGAAALFCGMAAIMANDMGNDARVMAAVKRAKRFIFIGLLMGIINALVPSTRNALIIWGVPNVIDAVSKNQKLQKIPDKLLTFIDRELDKRIREDKDGSYECVKIEERKKSNEFQSN
jgi:vacuolar-type H+-ATPase subunit I/STV1